MNQKEAEQILKLNPPYTKEEIEKAWHAARKRAKAEAQNSFKHRGALPDRLRRIDEAKKCCEKIAKRSKTAPTPAPSTKRSSPTTWRQRPKRQSQQPQQPQQPTPIRKTQPFSRRSRNPARKGASFANRGKTTRYSFQPRIAFSRAAIAALGALVLVMSVLGAMQNQKPVQTSASSAPASSSSDQTLSTSQKNQTPHDGSKSTTIFPKPTSPPSPRTTSSSYKTTTASIKILSYPWTRIKFINQISHAELSFIAPMRYSRKIPPGRYEARVIKNGEIHKRELVRLLPGRAYEIRIRLDLGTFEFIEKEMEE